MKQVFNIDNLDQNYCFIFLDSTLYIRMGPEENPRARIPQVQSIQIRLVL